MNAPIPTPYKIETNEVEERYARGWHVIGHKNDFSEKPVSLNYFNERLVAYRGKEDGEVHVLDAFCPHMGADLSLGEVKGNSLVCPFHSWSWGGDGVCNHIPYANKIPNKAVIASWPVTEINGLVFVWNDPEGNPPIPEQYPEKMEDYYNGEWTDWEMTTIPIKSNCRELVDNMADMAHFGPVHYSTVKSFSNKQDGHKFVQYMSGGHEILADEGQGFTSVATYEGPAYMTTIMTGSMEGQEMVTHLLVSHIPVHTEEFHIRFGVMMKKIPGLSEAENKAAVEEYTKMSITSFEQDIEIWNNKIRVDNPLMCDGDGPLHMLRKWYSQFYIDVADVTEDMVRAKEYVTEIKTKGSLSNS
jgi:3-ketosteroid 9alpha-monooxygenase subunit A